MVDRSHVVNWTLQSGRDDARHQSHGAHLRDLSCFLDISLHMALMSLEFGRPCARPNDPFYPTFCHASHLDGQVASACVIVSPVAHTRTILLKSLFLAFLFRTIELVEHFLANRKFPNNFQSIFLCTNRCFNF